jgi:PhnB protein
MQQRLSKLNLPGEKMTTINPYLNFEDNCEEAFNFYQSVFGGEFLYIGRYSEMECDTPPDESEANKIMHVSLPIGEGSILMGSDTPASFGPPAVGNNMSVSVNVDTVEEANRVYNGLSEGGEILMPMDKTFFAAAFGMFVDKFGVRWMVVKQ